MPQSAATETVGVPPIKRSYFGQVMSVLLGLGVLVLYAPTLSFPFQYDDELYLILSPLYKSAASFASMWNVEEFAKWLSGQVTDVDVGVNFFMRPVSYFTFYLSHAFGGLDPFGFRLVNVLLHAVNAVLAFLLAWRLTQTHADRDPLSMTSRRFIALTAAGLFAFHPLHTESTTYIVQRFTTLGSLFYLTAMLLHLRYVAAPHALRSWAFRWGSVLAVVLGMLSKESVFTAPLMLVWIHWMIVGSSLRRAVASAWPQLVCLAIVAVMMHLAMGLKPAGPEGLTGALHLVNWTDQRFTIAGYAASQTLVVLDYLRLVLLPTGLNIDPDPCYYGSWLNWQVLVSAASILGLVVTAWIFSRWHRRETRAVLVLTGLVWFFVSLLPSSSVVPLPDLMAEHRAYLGSVGVLLAVVALIDLMRTQIARRMRRVTPVLFALVGVWITVMTVATFARNEVWRTERSLWEDAVAKSPNRWKSWANLGTVLGKEKRYAEAERCLLEASRLSPYSGSVASVLSCLYVEQERYAEALDVAMDALENQPQTPALCYTLAEALHGLHRYDDCIQILRDIIAFQPLHGQSHRLLGLMLGSSHCNQPTSALHHLRTAWSLGMRDAVTERYINRLAPGITKRLGKSEGVLIAAP